MRIIRTLSISEGLSEGRIDSTKGLSNGTKEDAAVALVRKPANVTPI